MNGTTNIIMGLGKEMLSEGFEEVGQLFATEVGKLVGTGKVEFSDLATYGETVFTFLGAVGGLMGGGFQYAGYKSKIIKDTYQALENATDTEFVKKKLKEFEAQTKNKEKAMDMTNEWLYENDIPGVPNIVKDVVKSNITGELVTSAELTIKKIKQYETDAEQNLDRLGVDKTEGNKAKAMLLLANLENETDQSVVN